MSQRRRRAHDFTDSLNSFQHSTDSETVFSSDTFRPFSEDSLDECTFSSTRDKTSYRKDELLLSNTTRSSKHSIILAGSSTKNSLGENASGSSNTTDSLVQTLPDLNKRIDLFKNEKSSKVSKHITHTGCTHDHTQQKNKNDKENKNPQFQIKNKLAIGHSTPLSKKSENNDVLNADSKRDTNYNIEGGASNASSSYKNIHLEHTSPELKCTEAADCEDMNTGRKKFESLLCSLDNQLNQIKEVSQPQQVLKRLSDNYIHSPKNFTERLLTIIEESITQNEENLGGTSAVDLSRLTLEFRKMCKFIEDETVPEWPPSPLSTPPCARQVKTPASPACNTVHKNDSLSQLLLKKEKPVLTAPISSIERIKYLKKYNRRLSKNIFSPTTDNIINLSALHEFSNASFEYLEAQCKRLFCNDHESSKLTRKSLSMPSLMSMSDIQIICENQMASLNVSDTVEKKQENNDLKRASSLDSHSFKNQSATDLDQAQYQCTPQSRLSKLQELHMSKEARHNSLSYAKRKSRRMSLKPEFNEMQADTVSNNYLGVNPDELEKTLLQDIAEKRKRCLDTAKLIMEINADPEVTEAKKLLPVSPAPSNTSESNLSVNSEAKFLNTLMSCKKYHSYLKRSKPLFDLFHNTNSSTTETASDQDVTKSKNNNEVPGTILNMEKTASAKDIDKCYFTPDIQPYNTPKTPLLKSRDNQTNDNSENKKPKLFVTPGKSPVNKKPWKKPVYFPNMESALKKTMGGSVMKSPHAEGLYRLNYNTIISPVGMYIRGTHRQVTKNVGGKTNDLFHTPVKNNVKASPGRSTGRATPLKGINKIQEKVPLKVNLSPNHCTTPKLSTRQLCKEKQMNTPTIIVNENTPDNLIFPKVFYKSPLRVQTIKETETRKTGNRVKGLLESVQNKVVTCHEGRVNSAQKKKGAGSTKNNEICEIDYKAEDESIHIERAASKTNFTNRQRNF